MIEHKHLIIRAKVKYPPKNVIATEQWFRDLIEKIGMKLLRGPIGAYVDMPGNKGLTMVAVIETSHIAMHVWDEEDPALMQMDVYTCGSFNPQVVFDELEQFGVIERQFLYLDREVEIKEIPV
jgi:S-adenosylmethionine/arginine decarboxylase-like enzyme